MYHRSNKALTNTRPNLFDTVGPYSHLYSNKNTNCKGTKEEMKIIRNRQMMSIKITTSGICHECGETLRRMRNRFRAGNQENHVGKLIRIVSEGKKLFNILIIFGFRKSLFFFQIQSAFWWQLLKYYENYWIILIKKKISFEAWVDKSFGKFLKLLTA